MLKKNKIVLVPIGKEHLDQTRSWANNQNLHEKILRTYPVSEDEQDKWYADIVSNSERLVFAIVNDENNNHVGNTGLYNINLLYGHAEFWILIGEEKFQGIGIGKTVLLLMLKYAFGNLKLNKIYLHVGDDNIEAIKLYKKHGFIKDGMLRHHFFINGEYKNIFIMSILRDNYYEEK